MPKATNTFVWIIRHKVEAEKAGLIIPSQGKVKPHTGTIYSIGSKVTDKDIKGGKNKIAIFHAGIGFEITYKEATYLVLQENEIIGVDEP